MPRRFYVPEFASGPTICLTGSEAHHLGRVLRLKPGDFVTLFDGRGNELDAQIASVARDAVELDVQDRRTAAGDATPPITLAAAPPKGDRLTWLVEKATELGIDRFVPLITRHSVVHPGAGKLAKLKQTVVAASKQSRRARLMAVDEPTAWKDFVSREFQGACVLIADPAGQPLAASRRRGDNPLILAAGPEGGFTPEELRLGLEQGAQLVSLGRHILRIETAAIALAAVAATWEAPEQPAPAGTTETTAPPADR